MASAKIRAEQIIAGELARLRREKTDLPARHGGDPRKLAVVARLSTETTMTTDWIAKRLHIGTRGNLNHLLHDRRLKSDAKYAIIKTP